MKTDTQPSPQPPSLCPQPRGTMIPERKSLYLENKATGYFKVNLFKNNCPRITRDYTRDYISQGHRQQSTSNHGQNMVSNASIKPYDQIVNSLIPTYCWERQIGRKSAQHSRPDGPLRHYAISDQPPFSASSTTVPAGSSFRKAIHGSRNLTTKF